MKSIKPGRGPSMMGGIVGTVMVVFGLIWTATASRMSPTFALFGILWTGLAIAMTVYNFKNATSKNRYSSFDITDSSEESDPLNERFGNPQIDVQKENNVDSRFCPYCGTAVAEDYEFCNSCGKKLP
ncbi:MAG: zinc ribbon domain-containing protein [Clostridiales bacterium]|nr:zinc ribbon domain-containing protein [Clostridiales bacterium]